MENKDVTLFIQALREKVVPATGCTEPVAVALAAATSRKYLAADEVVEQIRVSVSLNIYKNALAVIVPGTGEPGLEVATAAGFFAGDPDKGLKVISDIESTEIEEIKKLAESGKVKIELAKDCPGFFVQVKVQTLLNTVTTKIVGSHTNIVEIIKNDQVILKQEEQQTTKQSTIDDWIRTKKLRNIWDFSLEVPLEKISFIKKAAELNVTLTNEGLKNLYGLQSGRKLQQVLCEDTLDHQLLIYTQAAADARMGGAMMPAMTNSGSGNQGITATIPVYVVAQRQKIEQEKFIRALALSHLVAIYIHSFLPVLSAFCAADSAAMGSAVGVCYLLDENFEVAQKAINNMAEDAVGMICDGAGCACALKVGNVVSSMYRAVKLAQQGVEIPVSNGMISEDIDQTIRNIGQLASKGMRQTDPEILDIMINNK
ncbi:serine dehydratase subunit alpha family protein [Companilactobacillus furfuricola]|uniref:L-cysteine desulfidase family protein n=1 Tax=Companilactobacillus furfuricola TaxID=1462575 RepID=UPI000F78F92D|nr:L-serine ammonia-lyase, iron-sulfur-dependent, subunit alpha [Companilactobacillus furfuricola]